MLDAVRTDPPPRSLRLSGGVAASPEADVGVSSSIGFEGV